MNAAVQPDSLGPTGFGKPDERELRDRMKKELPADTFKPQTWRVIWFLPLQLMIWGALPLFCWRDCRGMGIWGLVCWWAIPLVVRRCWLMRCCMGRWG